MRMQVVNLIAKLEDRVRQLEGALQQIIDETPPNEHKKWHHHHRYLFIARKALATEQGVTTIYRDGTVEHTTPNTEQEEEMYPCEECGVLRTKAEGGTTFTVCDDCWKEIDNGTA